MSSHHHFEELEVWKRACRLSVEVLSLIEPLKLYALRDQMARSAISIPSNIAEGAERETNKEFRRFLNIAKGSAGELRTQLFIGVRAGYFAADPTKIMINETKEISSMLQGLARSLDVKP
ncbi:four helix bundle protein [Roseibacillus ishigakijimensis]|uniref:Four helix bundle protein n=1 Tax=Roseibacillus ishigakijimensis TaxID=454146 RepID=A0A934RPJ5_9BACT|nr:four helix bundle protein [Roseibacillus ishigakijimensis]MBK1833216.1 four helix bundle protein [Roseibacillus ishigakijimensis]